MPGLIRQSYSSSSSTDGSFNNDDLNSTSSTGVHDDLSYPALSVPGYGEKPLSEQLEPIAVVGMGCRLPGDVSSPTAFWEMMINKKTGNTPRVPSSRFNIDAHFHVDNERPGSFNVLGGYFLNSSLKEFDPGLFGITPIEAMWMDPQQRKLLEVVYECFENGGVSMESIAGSKTACFVASFTADFQQMAFKEPSFRHSYAATGVDPGIISNRISHVFGLNGPSIVVNTACSSSVYALHNACNALRNQECSGAVVGGTNLVLTVDQHMNTAKLGVLSPSSTCHTFDASADGYGRADAVGALYLKRLSDAVRDKDPIRAVIRSSAVNSNGKVPAVGITHPNLEGQAEVIKHAYVRGGDLDPKLTSYFECHGTGTAVGDPLEVHALANAMNTNRSPEEERLWIGAVKTNIGHSEAASGISAVIKAVLSVEKGVIPPTRGVVNPNPAIDWEGWKVRVVNDPVSFPEHLPVKRISVNSFGYGGTNAHVIVESADSLVTGRRSYTDASNKTPPPRDAFRRKRPFLLPFSAHDKPTLKKNILALGNVVNDYSLLDLSYTLGNRRSRLSSRGFVVTSTTGLETAFSNDLDSFGFAEKKKTPLIGFAFTGQGAQWAKMGAELITYYPSFLRSIRILDRALEDLADRPNWTLEDVLLEDAATSKVGEAEFSQPLCTAIQIAVVQLLATWGIKPCVTVGHSSGEIGAAYTAGLISATEAIIAAYYRGKIVADVKTDGAMLAVGLGAEAVAPYLANMDDKVIVACYNSPDGVTLSGDLSAIETVKATLDTANVFARIVKTSGKAYHSHHMAPVSEKYESLMRAAAAAAPFDAAQPSDAIMVSSVTNSIITKGMSVDEKYWSANLRSPVLFNQAVQTIATDSQVPKIDLLIEIGPHSALSGPIRQICTSNKFEKLGYLPTLLRGTDSAAQLLKLAGELFLRNYPLDMERITLVEAPLPSGKIHLEKGRFIVDLPTYQWNYGKDLWSEVRHSTEHRQLTHARHDILGALIPGASLREPSWKNMLRIRDLPWLKDHSLGGEAVFPAAGYFSMAIEAITQLNEVSADPVNIDGYVLRDVSIKAALVTPDDDTGIEVIYNMRPAINNHSNSISGWWDFSVSSVNEEGNRKDHIAGSVAVNALPRGPTPKKVPNLPQRASGKSWNQGLREVGFDYGSTFQDMTDIRSDGIQYACASKTTIKTECGAMPGESRYVLHPACVDSTLQLLIASIYAGRLNDMSCGAVPIQVDEVAIWKPSSEQLAASTADAFSWIDQRGLRSFVGGSQLLASDGEVVMQISDMRCTLYEAAVPMRVEAPMVVQPYGEMVWKLDIDHLTSSKKVSDLHISELIELAIHKNPALKVLEIGCSYAAGILQKFGSTDYTVTGRTDDSVAELETIVEGYKSAKALGLDISADIDAQGLSVDSFDLIIASIKADDVATLTNVHTLLVNGGRAIIESGSTLRESNLKMTKFSGIDCLIQPMDGRAAVLTTALKTDEAAVDGAANEIVLVYRQSPAEISIAIEKAFRDAGWDPKISALQPLQESEYKHVVMIADFEGPLLATLKESELSAIQSICTAASSVLWVTPGGLLAGKKPEYAMVAGLARSITSEQISLNLTTLDFDLENTTAAQVSSAILTAATCQVSGTSESEYYVSDGVFHISRLISNDSINDVYAFPKESNEPVLLESGMRLVSQVQSGKVIFARDEESKDEILPPNSVEVRATVCGLSKEGVLVISGSDYPTTFSHELGGVIERVGSSVSGFAVGDEVFGFSFSNFATHQQVDANLLQKIAPGDSLAELVSLPMAYGAALYGLKELANLRPQETVLILSGTGHAGLAAIKMSQLMQAIPYVAVATEAEAQRVKAEFNLTDAQILLPTSVPLALQFKEASGNSGADVVFSSGLVDSAVAQECWRSITAFGRFIDSGRKNVLNRTVLDTVPFHRGANYMSFDILDIYDQKPRILGELLRLTISLYHQGSIQPLGTLSQKPIADIDEAVSAFSDDFSSGKTLLTYQSSEKSLNVTRSRPLMKFHADATYLLVGCLGGLGRSLTSWMMKKGARRFAFLSRSGTDGEQAAVLVEDVKKAGAEVQVIRGDVTVKKDVERAIKAIPSKYPLRGVVHAAMVLKDGLFHSMTYSNWVTSTLPKVQGTINLNAALQATHLDFFITTSSTSGTLGTPGQSNYAAGNAFMDSMSRHRHLNNKPSTSLVLPMVLGVGYVAEHPEIEEALKRKGIYGIDEEHLLEAFEVSMAIQSPNGTADHVIVGMDPSKLQKSLHEAATTDGFWMEDARFRSLIHTMKSASPTSASGSSASILSIINAAATPAQSVEVASEHFMDKLSRLLMVPRDEFEPDTKRISSYGLDSMIGAELRNWIFKEFALDIPFQQLLGESMTVTRFAGLVCANQGILVEG